MAILRVLLRVLPIALLAGVGACLIFQNQTLLSVTLLGTPLQPISLGILLLLSVLLGLAVGIILLFLLQTKGTRRVTTGNRRPRQQSLKNPFKTNPFESRSKQSRTSKSGAVRTARGTANSDWHEAPARDWVETPSASSETAPRTSSRDGRAPDYDDEPPFEPPPRQPLEKERVVDADYRVLRQPYSPPPLDEEWDDDFFREER